MFDLKVHHYKRKKMRNGQMAEVLDKVTPYQLFVVGKAPAKQVFLREGQCFWASGDKLEEEEVKALPSEIKDAIRNMSAEGKKTYGVPKGV